MLLAFPLLAWERTRSIERKHTCQWKSLDILSMDKINRASRNMKNSGHENSTPPML